DLERQLRRIAFESDFNVGKYPNIIRMVRDLTERRLLPETIEPVVRDILPLCNEAIHGGDVSTSSSQSVLAVGEELLAILQTLPKSQ
ncbi:hypothetical protein, partial [Mesorhizobium japonicum]|uniref:hypothetical protein n=1 Tax=Mesorhizobium japonicum TaxID=2066070 RepID=UPI003B59D322